MKKIIALAAVTLFLIGILTACGESETEVDEPDVLTVESSEEFADAIKANEEDAYETFKKFLSEHEYTRIEFDGTVVRWGAPVPSAKGLYMHVAVEDSNVILYKNGVTWNELPVTDGVEGLNVGARVHICGLIVDEDIEIKSIVVTVPAETDEAAADSSNTEQTNKEETENAQTGTDVTMVWIPQTGNKYHSRKSCSGMENPSQITKERAIELGYSACKRCH